MLPVYTQTEARYLMESYVWRQVTGNGGDRPNVVPFVSESLEPIGRYSHEYVVLDGPFLSIKLTNLSMLCCIKKCRTRSLYSNYVDDIYSNRCSRFAWFSNQSSSFGSSFNQDISMASRSSVGVRSVWHVEQVMKLSW